jgi:hypothetical protein
MQTADTLGKNHGQVFVELSEQALVRSDTLTAYPMGAVGGRYGIGERVDLGGRIGPSGIELQLKVQFTPPPPHTVVSLAPRVALWGAEPKGIGLRSYNVALPLLIGIALPKEHQLVLGPTVQNMLFTVSAGSAGMLVDTTYVGSSVGVAWKMPTTKRSVRIVTELGLLYPAVIVGDRSDGIGGVALGGSKWTLQGNLAFLIGGS